MQIDARETRAMQEEIRANQGPSPARHAPRGTWVRLTEALIELSGGHASLVRHAERSWASATFSGSRHSFALAFTGQDGLDAADRFIAALPDHEFTLPRRLVADAAVVACETTMLPAPQMEVEVELLLLDD